MCLRFRCINFLSYFCHVVLSCNSAQEISLSRFLFYQNQKCWWWWAEADTVKGSSYAAELILGPERPLHELERHLLDALQIAVDIQYQPQWQLVHVLHCRAALCCCTCAEYAGKLICSPVRMSMSIKLGALVNQASQYAFSQWIKIKIDIPSKARIFYYFFVLPLNVGDLSFKHSRVLCRSFWTSASVGLMLSQRQYPSRAKSPSCERLSESYRKSFCSHH